LLAKDVAKTSGGREFKNQEEVGQFPLESKVSASAGRINQPRDGEQKTHYYWLGGDQGKMGIEMSSGRSDFRVKPSTEAIISTKMRWGSFSFRKKDNAFLMCVGGERKKAEGGLRVTEEDKDRLLWIGRHPKFRKKGNRERDSNEALGKDRVMKEPVSGRNLSIHKG